jgi:uncharacterized protein (TIGR00369 family)
MTAPAQTPPFHSPYAQSLGLIRDLNAGRIMVTMPFAPSVLGRPGFLHGGAIAGLLENAAWLAALGALNDDRARLKPINVSVDFLRGGKTADAHASATIVRHGRRVIVVAASAWQDDESSPIATANLKLMVERPD